MARKSKQKKRNGDNDNDIGEARALRKAALYQKHKKCEHEESESNADDVVPPIEASSRDSQTSFTSETSQHSTTKDNEKENCFENPQSQAGKFRQTESMESEVKKGSARVNTKKPPTTHCPTATDVANNPGTNKPPTSLSRPPANASRPPGCPSRPPDCRSSTPAIPRPPKLEVKKLQRSCEKRRLDITKKKEEEKKKNKEVVQLSAITNHYPAINFTNPDLEHTMQQLKEATSEIEEKISNKNKELRANLENLVTEDYMYNKELKMVKIAHEELGGEETTLPVDKNIDINEEEVIPTQDAFDEARTILKRFLHIRQEKLASCVNIEIRMNKVSDNYANLLNIYRRNIDLLDFTIASKNLHGASQNNTAIGNRVLEASTKLLNKMSCQLREQDKIFFPRNDNISERMWLKKVKNYDSGLQSLNGTCQAMNECAEEKVKQIASMKAYVKHLERDRDQLLQKLRQQQNAFHESILKDAVYIEAKNTGADIAAEISLVQEVNGKTSQSIKNLKSRVEIAKKRRGRYLRFSEDVEALRRNVISMKQERKEKEMRQSLTRGMVCCRGRELKLAEEHRTELKGNIEEYRKQSQSAESILSDREYRHKRYCRKLKQFAKQMKTFQQNSDNDCKLSTLQRSQNTPIANVGIPMLA